MPARRHLRGVKAHRAEHGQSKGLDGPADLRQPVRRERAARRFERETAAAQHRPPEAVVEHTGQQVLQRKLRQGRLPRLQELRQLSGGDVRSRSSSRSPPCAAARDSSKITGPLTP